MVLTYLHFRILKFPWTGVPPFFWLVVSTPLKNMSSSVGMMTFPIYGKKNDPNHQPAIYVPMVFPYHSTYKRSIAFGEIFIPRTASSRKNGWAKVRRISACWCRVGDSSWGPGGRFRIFIQLWLILWLVHVNNGWKMMIIWVNHG